MFKCLSNLFSFIVLSLLKLRYRIKIEGLNQIPKTERGLLILPNHPAGIDPVILIALLLRKYRIRPVVLEKFYFLKGIQTLQRWINAVPIPDMSSSVNSWKQSKVQKAFSLVVNGLKKGDNFLVYPSGQLKETPYEAIGGSSFVHHLLKASPDSPIVLVRTTGLWGSRFSKAITGKTPDFLNVLWRGIGNLFKNFIFFTPRREVLIEFEFNPPILRDPKYSEDRLAFNHCLENWYNRNGAVEPFQSVPEFFFSKKGGSVSKERVKIPDPLSFIENDPVMEAELFREISKLAQGREVNPQQSLSKDLGLDSLDIAELYTFVKERYEIPDLAPGHFEKVSDLMEVIRGIIPIDEVSVESSCIHPNRWFSELNRFGLEFPEGKTLQEVFLSSCDRMGSFIACADDVVGILSYRDLKSRVLLLGRYIKQLEGDHIGVLMPSSCVAFILIFAVLMAGKVPVMLNWTTGVRGIDHAIQLSKVQVVLSSTKFLDRLNEDLGTITDKILTIEDLKRSISLYDKVWTFYRARYGSCISWLRRLKLEQLDETNPAVILFTSGTESLPKGVPLSHRNLLLNQRAAFPLIPLSPEDSLYSVLPPFHSFGFSVTGILPLFVGLKTIYAPDPKNDRKKVADINKWKITLFCAAPTFIKGLIKENYLGDLQTLRYLISGAEKSPPELKEFAQKLGANMVEGYGITECGPIVALTNPDKIGEGVGRPIPGVQLRIVDPETQRELPPLSEGEICIAGPNVFQGYLGGLKSPFTDWNGLKWYHSGDRGYIDNEGILVLSGRLKRFIKIGGEMVSLGGLETEILDIARNKRWLDSVFIADEGTPSIAVAAFEKEREKPLIVVFATFVLNKEQINEELRKRGYGSLIKISETKQLSSIPMTGTGKIKYSALDEII